MHARDILAMILADTLDLLQTSDASDTPDFFVTC